MSKRHFAFYTIFIFLLPSLNAQYLEKCWEKQGKSLNGKSLNFSYSEVRNELEHSLEAWQETKYDMFGQISMNNKIFCKTDSFTFYDNMYRSDLQVDFTKEKAFRRGYEDKDIFQLTNDLYYEQLSESARYSPVPVLQYFYKNKKNVRKRENGDLVIYNYKINNLVRLELCINKNSALVDRIKILQHDDTFGDIYTIIDYCNYIVIQNSINVANEIHVNKINGRVKDTISLNSIKLNNRIPQKIFNKNSYPKKEEIKSEPSVSVEKYNDHIYLVNLEHENSKSMVVEFKDFLAVIEAPLSSENGELIIKEARKITPNKPIKYFLFSHRHPHYTGGIRSFVHKGATILSVMDNFDYFSFIAKNQRKLQSDSLQMEPKMLKIEIIDKEKTITDDSYSMQLFVIGEKSAHTSDYTIFYFPKEKLIFEGDLFRIKDDGVVKKAGRMQKGLYNAIRDLNLDVDTIIQSWNPSQDQFKYVISFSELEKSVFKE